MTKRGYVYILTNPCIEKREYVDDKGRTHMVPPVKIGIAKDVEKRLGSLNTALPENFEHHLSMCCPDAKAVENIVHEFLERYRIMTATGGSTEFFACPVKLAVDKLKWTARCMHLTEYHIRKERLVGRSSSKIKANLRAQSKPAKKMKSLPGGTGDPKNDRAMPFSFSVAKIPIGAKLTFTELPLVVTVQDEKNKIEYEGKTYTLTGFVREFHPHPNRSGAYQGPRYFAYEGKPLATCHEDGMKGRIVTDASGVSGCGILVCTSRGANAKGYQSEEGFVVMRGSRISLNPARSFLGCKQEVKMREKFFGDGTIVGNILKRDVVCPSISSAAKLVMAVSANGNKAWEAESSN